MCFAQSVNAVCMHVAGEDASTQGPPAAQHLRGLVQIHSTGRGRPGHEVSIICASPFPSSLPLASLAGCRFVAIVTGAEGKSGYQEGCLILLCVIWIATATLMCEKEIKYY